MPVGLFRRPGARAVPQAVASWGGPIPVRTEAELRNAIGRVGAAGQAGEEFGAGFLGARIEICAPLTLGSPVEIGPTCRGLTIAAAGLLAITPRVALARMFLVNAPAVTLDGLFCQARSTSVFATTFVEIGDEDFAGDLFVMRDCFVAADRIFVDDGKGASRIRLTHNLHEDVSGTFAVPVLVDGRALIEGNDIKDGGSGVIMVTSNGSRCRIIGNACDGGDIDTSASGGLNTIAANAEIGAGSAFAGTDDATGGNT